jgi:hypothetical protein
MNTLARIGVGCGAVAALMGVGLVLVLPRILPEASRVIGPIQRVKRSQAVLEEMERKAAWKRPEQDALSPGQLDRFFAVRERVQAARQRAAPDFEKLPRRHVRSLEDLKQVTGVIHDVTDVVGAEMDAFVEVGMTPAEYRFIERLVYERWRGPLRKAGAYPVALRVAAAEVEAAAAGEADARVRVRLERVAREMRARSPGPPEGFDAGIHALLLERLDEVERLSLDDLVSGIPMVR